MGHTPTVREGAAPGKGVERDHQPAEQEDLGEGLAVGEPADPLLGQADRQHQGGQGRPARPDQTRGEPGEGEDPEGPQDRGGDEHAVETAEPVTDREDQGRSGHELGPDDVVALVVRQALVAQRGVVPRDQLPLLWDGQVPVLGDPRRVHGVGRGVPTDDQGLGVVGDLDRGEGRGDQQDRDHRPPGDVVQVGDQAGQQGTGRHHGGQPQHEADHRGEPAADQKREGDEKPGGEGDRGKRGHAGEEPSGKQTHGATLTASGIVRTPIGLLGAAMTNTHTPGHLDLVGRVRAPGK